MARTEFPRIKVTTKVARQFANLQLRNKTYDGNYIIWMTDIDSVPGTTLADRVKYVGGAMLTPTEAKAERNGTASSYASVYTPVYLDKSLDVEEKKTVESTGEDSDSEEEEAPIVTPVNPSVESPVNDSANENEEEEKE